MSATAVPMEQGEIRRVTARAGLARWLSSDLTRPLAFTVLALAYIASRVPFIDNGYGTKPDAWRIALTGYWFWDKKEFYPSRLPGYPIPEMANTLVIKGGWLATNSLTVAISLLGLWFFAGIVREVRLPNPALIVVGFAFQPLLWINSMNTMDYAWALTFIMGSYYFLLRGNITAAALMLGFAVGSRLPSSAFLLPYSVYLWRSGHRSEIRSFVVIVVGVALLAFSPIIWRYGPSFLNFYDAQVGYRDVIRLMTKDAFGLAGAAALALGVLLSLPRLLRLPGDFLRDKDVTVWVLSVVVILGVFFRLPHEAAYLIPLYPFGFLIMGRYFLRPVLIGVLTVMMLSSFVDFTTVTHEVSLSSVRQVRVGQGLILSNRDTQNAQFAFVRKIEQMEVPDRSVVMIGFAYPQFAVMNRDRLRLDILRKDKGSISQLSDLGKATDPQRSVNYVWLLNYEDFGNYVLQNYTMFYTVDAGRSMTALYDFRPGLFNTPPADVRRIDFGQGPSGSKDQGGRTQR